MEGLDEGGNFLSVVKGSEKIHCQALSLRERVQGQEHPDTLMGMNSLAKCAEGAYDIIEAIP